MVDRLFERLANAPLGLDCATSEVLAATGMFVAAILDTFGDARQERADRFCRALQRAINPTDAATRRH
jgi:hypothetical protein